MTGKGRTRQAIDNLGMLRWLHLRVALLVLAGGVVVTVSTFVGDGPVLPHDAALVLVGAVPPVFAVSVLRLAGMLGEPKFNTRRSLWRSTTDKIGTKPAIALVALVVLGALAAATALTTLEGTPERRGDSYFVGGEDGRKREATKQEYDQQRQAQQRMLSSVATGFLAGSVLLASGTGAATPPARSPKRRAARRGGR